MKMKKAAALLLAGVMTASCVTGCGSEKTADETKTSSQAQSEAVSTEEGGSEEEKEREPIEVEFMLLNNQSGDGEQFVLKKIVKEKFNIDLKLVLNTKDAHEEKLNLLIASNELPDLVSPLEAAKGKEIGPKGALVAVDEYFDIMPNFEKKVKEDKNVYASLMAADGHIYSMPRFADTIQFKSVPLIRMDMLEAVGKEAPANFKELVDVLEAIKAKFPDTIGMINRNKMNCLWAYGIHYGTNQGMFYDNKLDQWVYGPLNDGFKEMITDFHTLWEKGLMDKEFFTASTQQWEEKILNNQGVFTLDFANRSVTETDAYKKLHPEDTEFKFNAIMPLVSDYRPEPTLNIAERVGMWTSFGVSADSPHIERILEMIDWMYTEEGATLVQWGFEGEHYTVENGMKKYVPEIQSAYNPEGTLSGEMDLGLNHNRIMRLERADGYEEYIEGYSDMLERYKKETEMFENNYRISLTLTDDELEESGFISTNTKTYVEEEALKFITGERDLAEYDEFVAELKENGAERLEEIYADAYARYKEQMSSIQ